MQIDARTLDDGQTICSDVCVVGGGPAGTTLAHEFLDQGVRVVLLESGGTKQEPRVQKLSEGSVSGDLYEPIEETHLRQLGGTANHWIIKMTDKRHGFRYAPLRAIDFEQRDAIPYSGWPLSRADLDPYYSRAHEACEIGPCRYEPGAWESDTCKPLPLDGDRVVTDYFSFGPTDVFTKTFPQRFERSNNVHTYIHATVTELLTDESGSRVEAALVKTFDGKEIRFEARQFVVAGGGYCTTRLLLASRGTDGVSLGNQHDVLGRYYMDHSLVPSGNLHLHDPRVIDDLGLYDMRDVDGACVLAKLGLSDKLLRQEGLRNFSAALFPMPTMSDVDALVSLHEIYLDLRARRFPRQLVARCLKILRGIGHIFRVAYRAIVHDAPLLPGLAQGGWSRVKNNHNTYPRVELLALAEQSPHPDNRITLLDEKDELGCPRINVHFEWDQADLQSISHAQEIFAEELTKTGLGDFEESKGQDGPVIGSLGLHHLMGGTRMSDDPRHGVVDADCKVFGTDNLYIASSSVFPTGGYANPTLTILALAIRIADTLKTHLSADATDSI